MELLRHSISSRLLAGYLSQPYAFFLGNHAGDLGKKILSEVDLVVSYVIRPFMDVISYSIVLIPIFCFLIFVDPRVAFLNTFLFCALYFSIFFSLKRKLFDMGETMVQTNKGRFRVVHEAFGGIKYMKLIGKEEVYLDHFKQNSLKFCKSIASHHTISLVPNFIIEAVMIGVMLILTIFLIIASGGIDNGSLGKILPILGAYGFATYRIKPAAHQVYQGFVSLRYGKSAVDSLHKDMHLSAPKVFGAYNEEAHLQNYEALRLSSVDFEYPGSKRLALENINLTIPVGTSIGIVGKTGASKTTLVDIILGLLEPTEGSIFLDNKKLGLYNNRAWQKKISYVPQDIFLIDKSVSENIAFGFAKEKLDQKQVEHCARLAGIHDFITQELSSQYETVIGERGIRISGGQRQRLAIARALYQDPQILVLDEATSSLDSFTEKNVMKAIESLTPKKTVIIVAHRLSTIQNCQKIVVLDSGKIDQIGTYEELLNHNLVFKEMLPTN